MGGNAIRFAAKASFLGGLIGTWEAAATAWRDAELTFDRAGGFLYALEAFALYATVFLVGALAFAWVRGNRVGGAILGRRAGPFAFAVVGGAACFCSYYLNAGVLPAKLHPLSLAVDAVVLAAAWLALRFLPPLRWSRPLSVALCAVLMAGGLTETVWASRSGTRLPPPDVPPPWRKPNVFLITVDTTRADRLGCYGHAGGLTPHLDRLAARGRVVERAYCPMPLTGPSHAALLTGKPPRSLGIIHNGVKLPEGTRTLAGALRTRGYRTGAVVGAFPVSSKLGFAEGFEFFDDAFSPLNALTRLTLVRVAGMTGRINTKGRLERRAEEVTERAASWLTAERRGPLFLWVHYYDAHTPYDPPGRFATVSGAGNDAVRRYEGEVAYVDSQIGELLTTIEKAELDDAVIIVVADHGESLGEHDYYYDHGRDVYEPCLRVPLIIAAPVGFPSIYGAGEEVNGRPVSTTSIYEWLLAGIDGRTPEPTPEVVYGESMEDGWHMRAAVAAPTGGEVYKYVYDVNRNATALYNLGADGGETADVSRSEVETSARLARELDAFFRKQPAPGGASVDKATKEKLRSLGYF